jgi:Flp pilus assembly protein TadD
MGATATSLPTTFQHYAAARTAFFSADAKAIITASDDLTAVRWTRGSMKPTGRPMVHESKVMCAVFNHDRSLMATISEDGKASLWNGETNQRIGEAHDLGGAGRWVDFAPDGKRFIATAGTKAVIWSADKGDPVGEPIEHASHGNLNTARFSPDGKWIVTASDDKTACVWETESHKLVATLSKHEDAVLNARFSFDGTRLVTAGADGAIIVWDTATWQQTGKNGVMPGPVYSAVISPDNRFVVATSANANGVGFFHIPSGRLLTQIVEIPTDADSVDLDPKGDAMVVACMDGTVRTYGTPFVQEDVPKWVPDFAERLVGMRKEGPDNFALVDTDYSDLKKEADKIAGDLSGDFARLAQWSLTASAERTGMPRTRTKISDIIVKRVEERSLQALHECFDADPEDPLVIAALSLFVPTQRQGEFLANFALERSQNNPLAESYVASTFAKYDRMEDAERVMKAALAAAPNDPRVLRRAAKLDTRQNRKEAAIEKLDRAVAADPQDEVTYRDYGWMMYNLNDSTKAIEQFKKADELCGSADTDINAGMALAYAALGDQADSIKRYRRLIKIGNEWGDAEYLKALRGWTDKELAGMENIRVLAVKP